MPMVRLGLRIGKGANGGKDNFLQRAVKIGIEPALAEVAGGVGKAFVRLQIVPYNAFVSTAERSVPSGDFFLRDYKKDDFDMLWRIDQQCFPPEIAYSTQELRMYMQHRGAFTLVAAAREDGPAAGFIVAHGGVVQGHIVTIDVSEQARRAGVGSLLLSGAEDRLRVSGSAAVALETAVDNAPALSFYKRHGYSVVRVWPRYYSNGVDALVLSKNLR